MNVYLPEMTSKEAGAALAAAEAVIVPIGSVEWHGPHLPLNVDHLAAHAYASAAAGALAPAVLHTHVIEGVVRGQMQWPGSITIPPHTLIETLVGVCQSLNYHGIQRVLLLNGHGSNRPCALSAALRASKQFDMRVAAASWWDFSPEDAGEAIMEGHAVPGHAGDCETSLMLHLAPETVRVDEALREDWQPELDGGRAGVAGWRAAGIDRATPEKGQALFTSTLARMVAWLRDFCADRVDLVPPSADREGYTTEFLGTRLWYFWAEENQQYMEQFRPRFRDKAGRPYPGVTLDAYGDPIRDPSKP